ncbi:hypothetical protein HDU98_006983 [Podochytrium sp. JEL0797]|nr:hypothetical protein HDU98_006983 [Podochytrium sp. JEL0797]
MTSLATIAGTNTNTQSCFGIAPNLAHCLPPSDAPSAVCCDAVFEYNKAGCFCNPITTVLFGADLAPVLTNTTLPICAGNRPKKHWTVPCGPFQRHTYNYGTCAANDMEMDTKRVITVTTFQAILTKIVYNERWGSGCFNITDLLDQVTPLLDPLYSATVAYGLGTFHGIAMALEYLAILNAHLNRNVAFTTINPNKNVVGVLPDGEIVLGGYNTWSFFNGTLTAPEAYVEFLYGFVGCNTATILSTTIPPGSVLHPKKGLVSTVALINGILSMVQQGANWGAMNTCKFHTRYCTGPNQQFATEQDCLDYFTSLPVYSPVCGKAHLLGGNSIVCRGNHQFLSLFDPKTHCPHLSPQSAVCRDPGPNDDIDTFCGLGGDEEVMDTVLKTYKEQVHEIMVGQNATVLSPSWKWDYPEVC